MSEVHFTFVKLTGWPFWARVKLAAALVLTPLTLLLIGRSITVTLEELVCEDCAGKERDEVPAD